MVSSFEKNATRDSAILTLSDGTRLAVRDSVGSGGGGGVTTMAAIGATPNANGATISGSTLNLQPASASFGGVVTTGTQTFVGEKTFTSVPTLGPGAYGGLSYKLRSDLSISGNEYGEWHFLPTSGDFRLHFNNGSYVDNSGAAGLIISNSIFLVRVPASFTNLANTSFTNALGSKLVYNGGTGTSQVGVGSAYNDMMNFVPSGNNFRWHNSGQFIDNAASALMFLSSGLLSTTVPANIGTYGAPPSSAILSATSTTKGFLPPRMTTAEKNAIVSPAAGLIVYDTTLNKLCVFTTVWETITSL
jgi:hypothetical protein